MSSYSSGFKPSAAISWGEKGAVMMGIEREGTGFIVSAIGCLKMLDS
jgi:hypothetical protein